MIPPEGPRKPRRIQFELGPDDAVPELATLRERFLDRRVTDGADNLANVPQQGWRGFLPRV